MEEGHSMEEGHFMEEEHSMGNIDEENISEELVVLHCLPTMAGLKTGNLFNCPARNSRTFIKSLREMNSHLIPRGARIVPLKNMEKSVLVYMYRPDRLREDLDNSAAGAKRSRDTAPLKDSL